MNKILFLLLVSLFCNSVGNCSESKVNNPHNAQWLDDSMIKTLDSIKRIDEKGVLYEMNYVADYYATTITDAVEKTASTLKTGCSAFSTFNTKNDFLFCRNYDYMHKDSSGNATGLTVVIHTAPLGKLKSIGVCDAFWLNQNAYFSGSLDDGKTDTSALVLSPYMCVDGINEAGLAAALLLVDTKEGETKVNQNTGKKRATQAVLLRLIIDNAHNIQEAVDIAKSYDVYSVANTDLHMYLTDKTGNSAVLEWRQFGEDKEHKLYVTYTNACTNFFVGFDDGANAYRKDGSLKELFAKFTATFNSYKYGYGHGYHRFNQIVASLERYLEPESDKKTVRNSIMNENQALDILKVISQDPGTERTSFTQFSAVYNLTNLTVTYWVQRNYDKSYNFKL